MKEKDKLIQHVVENNYFEARKKLNEILTNRIMEDSYSSFTIRRAVKYINEHLSDKILLSDLAGHVDLSSEYLCRIFKKFMGITFKKYINLVRIKQAEELLLTTELSMKRIAERIGIQDEGYFNKIFREYNKCTPSRFRSMFSEHRAKLLEFENDEGE